MDLRVAKTKFSIKKAFMKLLGRSEPSEIKVKDICSEAKINKTTFYKHYRDSVALIDEIYMRAVDKVVERFSERELLFEDPMAYISGLYFALEAEIETLRLVFRGKTDVLCTKLEERLKSFYSFEKSTDKALALTFIIGGCVRVVQDYLFSEDHNLANLADSTAKIANIVIEDITE